MRKRKIRFKCNCGEERVVEVDEMLIHKFKLTIDELGYMPIICPECIKINNDPEGRVDMEVK